VGLIARGEAALAAAATALRETGAQAATAVADVTASAALRDAADAIVTELGPPNVWINCAGNGVYGRFTTVPEAQFDWVTAVTYGGTVNGCRVALALMGPRQRGTIVNVCSAMAFHGLPLMSSYAGAKAAVRGYRPGAAGGASDGAQPRSCLHGVPTSREHAVFLARRIPYGLARAAGAPVYQPEVVAVAIHLAAIRGRPEVVVSGTAVVFSLATRVSPRLIAFMITRLGFDGQLTSDPDAARLQRPTLFSPSAEASPVHGPFGRHARRRSLQVWLSRHQRRCMCVGVLAGVATTWVMGRLALP